MRHLSLFGSSLLLALLLGVGVSTEARAQAPAPESVPVCGQKGRVTFDKDTLLVDTSGRKLARFSGGESAVTLVAPPATGSDLVRIETGTGKGSFRLSGYVKASELRIFASYAVPIVSGHLWLAPGTRVAPVGVSGGKVRIEKQMSTPFKQRFTALADCSALTFSPPAPTGFSMPGSARVYLMKVELLDLYPQMPPTGSPFITLQRSPFVDNVRFFSTEQRGGFVHVQYQGDINVDAWAKASDLTALPRGETSDLPPGSYTLSTAPQLQLSQAPRVVRTTRELPLRLQARDAEPSVGVIEAETDVYVMDTIAGWANVLPKSLHVLPTDQQSFWVKSADLGLP